MSGSFASEESQLVRYFKKKLLFKFVIIGDFGVGKTSIIKRYSQGVYSNAYKITIGADFALKTFDWDDCTRITLQLWDIAGHERFGSLTSVYYRYAVAAVIVFDLTRPETFGSVEKWLADLREKVVLPNGKHLPVVLLANKGDVCLANLPAKLPDFCRKNNILSWFITSAKDDTNIDEAMFLLTKVALTNHQSNECNGSNLIALSGDRDKQHNKRSCCQHI